MPHLAEYNNLKNIFMVDKDNIIVGRDDEIAILNDALTSNQSEFIAIYGRRRVGKTYLIREYYKPNMAFHFTGAINAPLQEQLLSFYNILISKHKAFAKKPIPATWMDAFYMLRQYISTLKTKKKKVIFLDEVPWLDSPKSGFLRALDYFWNSWANWEGNIVLVICGSAASWIINKVVNNKGGLHNRLTKRIRLEPFSLLQTKQYLQKKKVSFTNYQIVQLFMVTGGIPLYLSAINPALSVVQNINNLCFTKDGLLHNEFDNLYTALFRNADKHVMVINALAQKNKGLTRNEILAKCKWKSGGTLTVVLNELIESGFIDITQPFRNKNKETLYRLTDAYSIFYLKFIANKKYTAKDVWASISEGQSYKSWSGFAFENICLQHIESIKVALGISGITASAYSFVHKGTEDYSGVQIDLLIDRSDGFVHLCEMKFSKDVYTITKDYDSQLREKQNLFEILSGTKKGIFLTMLTTYGIKQNMYSFNIPHQLNISALFS